MAELSTPGASAPAPVVPGPLPAPAARSVTAPVPEDLEIARADALLQLRIGRSAHYYAVLVSIALIADAILVVVVPPPLTTGSFAARNLYFLYPPVLAGLFLAVFGLLLKWDEFQLWPWERHFWATVLAVVAGVAATYLLLAGTVGVGPTAAWPIVPYLFPLAIGVSALAMVGLALTWRSYSSRQLASVIAAALPFPLAFVVLAGGLSSTERAEALALTIFAAGWLFQTSGSFLHLISSGTRAHEREMMNSGQTRMFLVADELRKREDALALKEATVRDRETTVDDGEISLKQRTTAADEQRGQLLTMESDLRRRSDALAAEQKSWAARSAEAKRATQAATDKEADLVLRERQLADRLNDVGAREERLVAQEGDLAGREAELARGRADLERRETMARSAEARLDVRRTDADRRTAELVQREAQLRTKETLSVAGDQDRVALAQRLADLEGREGRLQQLELSLQELRGSVERQTTTNAAAAKELAQREERHGRALAEIAARETRLQQREDELEAALRGSEAAKLRYEEAVRRVEAREAEGDARAAELDKRLAQVQEREHASVDALRRSERDSRLAEERAKALDRREVELRDRARPEAGAPAPATAETAGAGEASPALEAREARRLPGRESIGVPRMDDLLLGGLPPKAHVLLLGPPFVGKELLLYQFVAEGLRRGERVVLVSAGRPASEAAESMRAVVPELAERERQGRVLWVEAVAPAPLAAGTGRPAAALATRPAAEVLAALVQASRSAEAGGADGFRVGLLGIGHLFRGLSDAEATALLQNLVGVLKPRKAIALYTLDDGLVPDALLGVLKSRMDGVIEFREDRGRSFLAVRGLGEVETRDWVEYRTGPAGLTIGSFHLERIR